MTTQQTNFGIPWSLHFDRVGTEDIATICDANGDELVCSRHFWLPERDDPIPTTLAAVRLMAAAPKLLSALLTAEMFIRGFEADEQQERIDELLAEIRTTIADANGNEPAEPRKPIVIEVLGGIVQYVQNVPPGYEYEIRDYDDLNAEADAVGGRAA